MVELNQQNREEYTLQLLRYIDNENLDLFRQDFLELHPIDQLDVYYNLTDEQRKFLYYSLSPAEFAEIFKGMSLKEQKQVVQELAESYTAEMLNNMYSDDVAAFLAELEDFDVQAILSKMDKAEAEDVQELLAYPPETAGAIMTTEFISIEVNDTVDQVIEKLRKDGPEAETIYYLYVIDNTQRLVGVLSLRDLIISKLEQRMEEIMSTRIVSVPVSMDQEEVAQVIKNYDFLAVPVITENNQLVGIVTVDDVMDILEDETNEDFGEITAAKGSVDLEISSREAAKKRLPWLIMLLFIGMFTAGIIGRFEDTLGQVPILAVFMPLIAGMAGNTGTQSLAVVVRGLAVGKMDRPTVIHLIKRETATGIMIGVVCGIVVAIISQVVTHGNLYLGFIVGFYLFFTLIVATAAGSIIPLLIDRLKIDPAVASGPFITTINDIVALLIYFSIATSLLAYLQ